MIPILFEHNATDFTTHGIGDLVECTSCECQCNDEGEYELSFIYPKDGDLFHELTIGRQILAKVNPWQQTQIFRIYGYEKELKGMITVNCEHISYDLNRIPVKDFKSAAYASCNTVLQNMVTNANAVADQSCYDLNINRFTFVSDVDDIAQTEDKNYILEAPSSARSVLLDGDDSIKGVFGGNLVFDRYNVKILKPGSEEGGMDRGVTIEYGVDLMDLQQEENISEMYTGVLPYFRYTVTNPNDQGDTEMISYGTVQHASGTFQNHKIMPLDLTEFFPNQAEHTSPAQWELNNKAQEWMAAEDGFGEPEINLTLSYAQLGQDVRLHDQVTVRFPRMGINSVASKVTSYKYDVLKERMLEVQVGKTKESILFSLEDASRLKKGLLPPKRIQNKSITSEKYADGSVQSAAIGSGSVGSSKIAGGAVTTPKIDGEAVTTEKIKRLAVTAEILDDDAVINGKIKDGAVTTLKIGDYQVAKIKLDQNSQDAISTVWELDRIITNHIDVSGALTAWAVKVGSHTFQARTISYTNSSGFGASMVVLGEY